ncbi:MAG: YfiT family bacillithiol transferase [Trueperaceae bacterium]
MPLVYPIGRVSFPETIDPDALEIAIARIEALPHALRAVVADCRDLDHPIRDGAWSIRALVHHVADSHMNAYVRTKLALTEDAPVVKPNDVVAWTRLGDADLPLDPSLQLIDALHARWSAVLRALGPEELARPWRVPTAAEPRPLWRLPLTYAWHGDHHVAQIRQARDHFGI